MSRKSNASQVAAQASEAARVLQARGQEVKQEVKQEVTPEVEAPVRSTPEPRNDRRKSFEDEIEAREAQQREAEAPEVTEPAAPQGDPAEVETSPTEPTVAAEAPEAPQTPVVETVRVKVDGEEFDVAKADIDEAGSIRAYQKEKAADNRLKKSNQELAEIKKTQAAILEWATKQAQPQTPQVTNDQFIAQKLEAIRYGTPEEGAAALTEILQKTQQKFDPNVMTAQAVAQMSRKMAVDKFKDEFADVVANPLLAKLAVTLEQERITQNPQAQTPYFDWSDFYRKIGNEIRSVVPRQSQPQATGTTTGTPSPQSEKEARKASIVTLPTAAARAESPKEEKPETREEMITGIKKSRGLPVG
jgi:hypothetical protein